MFFNKDNLFSGAPVPNQSDVQGDYRSALDQLSQNKKIEILGYFDEHDRYDGTTMLYRSHVSLKLLQTGQIVVGSSMDVESNIKAREQAAEHAWYQIRNIEQKRLLQVQEGRGE